MCVCKLSLRDRLVSQCPIRKIGLKRLDSVEDNADYVAQLLLPSSFQAAFRMPSSRVAGISICILPVQSPVTGARFAHGGEIGLKNTLSELGVCTWDFPTVAVSHIRPVFQGGTSMPSASNQAVRGHLSASAFQSFNRCGLCRPDSVAKPPNQA